MSGVHPGGPEGVGRPSRRGVSGREALPKGWKDLEDLPEGREGLGGPPKKQEG